MRVQITGRHVSLSADVKEYAEEKLGKLPKFYDRIHEIEIIFDQESEQFSAEAIVRADQKHTFVASESGSDRFGLIDALVDKLERQLTKHKEKSRNHKHDGKAEPPPEAM